MASHRKDTQPTSFPAPWTCKCETYWMLLWLPKLLPSDIYAPLEASSPAVKNESFRGGMGMIQIVRYSDTPVGAYDELVLIPGNFAIPAGRRKGKAALRITRIYVSQRETCFNGRNNWSIPKHLARFSFSAPPVKKGTSPPSSLTVSVFPPNRNSQHPFFTATLTPSHYMPTFPLSTAYLPTSSLIVQPPLPAGDEAMLCGTEVWRSFVIGASTKRTRWMWVKSDGVPKEDREGLWPDVAPYGFGVWLEDATLEIPEPGTLGLDC